MAWSWLMSLVFDGKAQGHVVLNIGNEVWTGPVGLDGVYRFSPSGHRSLPMAVSGKWRRSTEFVLDVNLVPNITRILFAIRFLGDRAELDITDTTGSFHDVHLSGWSHD